MRRAAPAPRGTPASANTPPPQAHTAGRRRRFRHRQIDSGLTCTTGLAILPGHPAREGALASSPNPIDIANVKQLAASGSPTLAEVVEAYLGQPDPPAGRAAARGGAHLRGVPAGCSRARRRMRSPEQRREQSTDAWKRFLAQVDAAPPPRLELADLLVRIYEEGTDAGRGALRDIATSARWSSARGAGSSASTSWPRRGSTRSSSARSPSASTSSSPAPGGARSQGDVDLHAPPRVALPARARPEHAGALPAVRGRGPPPLRAGHELRRPLGREPRLGARHGQVRRALVPRQRPAERHA